MKKSIDLSLFTSDSSNTCRCARIFSAKINKHCRSSNLLRVINVYNTLLHGPFFLIEIERSLSEDFDFRCFAIKHFGNLLESPALGFGEEEVDRGNHGCESADVDEVEFPGDGLERDRVAELVEN
jgi:hypothetical protein